MMSSEVSTLHVKCFNVFISTPHSLPTPLLTLFLKKKTLFVNKKTRKYKSDENSNVLWASLINIGKQRVPKNYDVTSHSNTALK